MSVTAIGELGAIAPPTATTAAAGGGGWNPMVAAAERIQQLQALISQVETGTFSRSFSAALSAAQTTGVAANAAPSAASQPDGAVAQPGALAAGDPYPAASAVAAPSVAAPIGTASSATPIVAYGPPTTTGASTAPVAGAAYVPMIEQAAARNGLDPALLYGLIEQESGFDPSARSGAGAAGLTQLMPGTAASLGVAEPLNPAEAIEGGARYLAEQLRQFGGNAADALAAYNAGPGAVRQYGGVPPYAETQQYVSKVLGYAAAYTQSAAGEVRA